MDDVEFHVDSTPAEDPARTGVEDVVEVEPRVVPRWVIVAACVAATALVLVLLAVRQHSHPSAQTGPSTVPSPTSSLEPFPVSQVGPTVAHVGNEIALDVALAGNLLYTLRYDLLTTTDASRGTVVGQVHVAGLDYFYGGPTMHLFLDPRMFTAWVLSQDVSPPQILEFNSTSLTERRTVVAPGAIHGAAILHGRLYLATTAGVAAVTPRQGKPTLVPGSPVQVEAIAADPARNRLLAIDSGSPQHIMVITPGRGATMQAATRLISPALAVVGDRIWVSGYTEAGPVVERLDPVTLQPIGTSPVAARAGPGAQLMAGESVLWVSAGVGDPQQLWCVNADNGAIGGYWPGLSGAVTSRNGMAYAVRGGEVVVLPSTSACRG